MAVIVQKYGGSLIRDFQNLDLIVNNIVATRNKGHDVVAVVSAMYGETRRLRDLALSITETPSTRELDSLLATGEQVSSSLISILLNSKGIQAESFSGVKLGIVTDSNHNAASILHIETNNIIKALKEQSICVVAGFQGIDNSGNVTTLGFEGSDTTAVALAAALTADECQIYKDVAGIYTADPKIIPNAKLLSKIDIKQMLETSSLGSQVLHKEAIAIASKNNVKLQVKSPNNNCNGTSIVSFADSKDLNITGISCKKDITKVIVEKITKNKLNEILALVYKHNLIVDLLKCSVDEIIFTMESGKIFLAKKILVDITNVKFEGSLAQLSLVGANLKDNTNVITKIITVLSSFNASLHSLLTTDSHISILLDSASLNTVAEQLHSVFIDVEIDVLL